MIASKIIPPRTDAAFRVNLCAMHGQIGAEMEELMELPKDPVMLLSFVNTQLRDYYPSLLEFSEAFDIPEEELKTRLKSIDYVYDEVQNRFI